MMNFAGALILLMLLILFLCEKGGVEQMAEILEYFKDINFMYNDCSVYDTLSQMLVEFQAEIREKVIDEFAYKLKERCYEEAESFRDIRFLTVEAIDIFTFEIAEQLKGET